MKIRIHCWNIKIDNPIILEERHAHYLSKVMRRAKGESVILFNQTDGEFECKILDISYIQCVVIPYKLITAFIPNSADVICVFSLIKAKNIELIIQKCTEIGVHFFIPLNVARSSNEKINYDRLHSIATESAEQCGRLNIPAIMPVHDIPMLSGIQNDNRRFILLSQNGNNITMLQSGHKNAQSFIISGPEGGFTSEELQQLEQFTIPIKISKNLLRAETAAIIGCGLLCA